jgi:hypothetical protein
MIQNPLDDCGLLDAGDDAQVSTALPAGLDVDGEQHGPGALFGNGHRGHRSAGFCSLPHAVKIKAKLAENSVQSTWHRQPPGYVDESAARINQASDGPTGHFSRNAITQRYDNSVRAERNKICHHWPTYVAFGSRPVSCRGQGNRLALPLDYEFM